MTVDAVDTPGATAAHVTVSLAKGKLEVDGRTEKGITSPRRQPVPVPLQFDASGPGALRKRQLNISDVSEITLMSPGDIIFLYTDGVYDGSDEQDRAADRASSP